MKKFLLLFGLLMLSAPVYGAEVFDFNGYYRVRWGGLDLAEMALSFHQTGRKYEYRADIYSRGLVRLFTDHKSHTTASGNIKNTFIPRRYDTVYTIRKKTKEIHLRYDARGRVAEERFRPPRDRESEEITAKQKEGSLDPLSLLGEVRRRLPELITHRGNIIRLPVYDGKRLMEGQVQYLGKATVRAGKQRVETYKLSATRTPIAGFSAKELRKYREGESPLIVYFSMSTHLPVRLEFDMQYGRIVAELEKECANAAACAINWNRPAR